MTTGYSGTPLFKKLGIKPGSRILLIAPPVNIRALLEPLPDAVQFVDRLTPSTDIVHGFFVHKTELQTSLASCRSTLNPSAMFWISWPKRSSKVPTDITEDVIRSIALPMGFVDIKVCAIDDVWSGLKLVIRKELRRA